MKVKEILRSSLPKPVLYFLRKLRALPEDFLPLFLFLFNFKIKISFAKKFWLIYKCYRISYSVDCPHMESEIIEVMSAILSYIGDDGPGVVVEAGSYKGGSSAKLSLVARLANKKLVIFDSFEGLPQNKENHGKNIFGGDAYFPGGSYACSLDEVKNNIKKFGDINVCEFKKGWFEDSMPGFKDRVLAAYIDVDLESSTKTCIKYLYPLLVSGGIIFSQDGHLPLIIKLLNNEDFWEKEVGCEKPKMMGLGNKKLVAIFKNENK